MNRQEVGEVVRGTDALIRDIEENRKRAKLAKKNNLKKVESKIAKVYKKPI